MTAAVVKSITSQLVLAISIINYISTLTLFEILEQKLK